MADHVAGYFVIVVVLIALATLLVIAASRPSAAQNTAPLPPVSVFWKESTTVRTPGLSRVVVLDETICHAEAVGNEIQLQGVGVGNTGHITRQLRAGLAQHPAGECGGALGLGDPRAEW